MINKIIKSIRTIGFFKTTSKAMVLLAKILYYKLHSFYNYLIRPFSINYIIHKQKIKISNRLAKEFNGIVHYGLLKGFIIGNGYKWGQADLGNMMLGLYEKEVIDSIADASKTHSILIDLGAADGYFAIGCLVNNMFKKTYCYEMSIESQKNLRDNAILNNVSERLDISGIASDNFFVDLINKDIDLSQCVLLSDIEGNEFHLFNDNVFKAFRKSIIIIEIHEWHENGLENLKSLKKRASKYFEITEMKTGARDLSEFPEVAKLNDHDRWLLCSEGRHHLMTWLRLDPKKNISISI